MSLAMQFIKTGDPDVLTITDMELGVPAPGEVRLRQTAIGVNYVDVYHRTGIYPLPQYPAVPGVEAVGVIDAIGTGVSGLSIGDRVAYACLPAGSYVQSRVLPADRLILVPQNLSDKQLAGSFLRGLTADLLLNVVGKVQSGHRVLIHGAAGGLGLILVQWAKILGAVTIGTVGSADKAELARSAGLDHAILYREADFIAETLSLTGGIGVDFAVDGIGGAVLANTLKAVRPLGIVANIGQVGGIIPPVDPALLTNRFLIRPSILGYVTNRLTYEEAARAWFAALSNGVQSSIGNDYPLLEAARAHDDLEKGRTAGSVRLWP
jgi:NADPH2:quinone reductase